jgi:hypothetical protein
MAVSALAAACGGRSLTDPDERGETSAGGTLQAGAGGATSASGSESGGADSSAAGSTGTPQGGQSAGGADGAAGVVDAAGGTGSDSMGGMAGSGSGAAGGGATAGGTAVGGAGGAGAGTAGETGDGGEAGAGEVVDEPDFSDLVVQSSQMSAYEGLPVIATFDQNFDQNSRSPARMDVVSDGAFTLIWKQAFNRLSYGSYLVLFVDRESDGWCTESIDPAWAGFINNGPGGEQPLVHDFDPESQSSPVIPITCAEFDTWAGKDFPGL